MSEIIEAYTDSDLAYRIVLLKTLVDLVLDEFKASKQLADQQLQKGASIPARTDSDDTKLGRVTKSDPKPVAKIVDQDAVDDYIRAHFPDKLTTRAELGDISQILAILQDLGRTDLYTVVHEIPDYLYGQVKAAAVKGQPIPGVELHRPKGVVSATSEPAAAAVVRELLSGARVPLLRELEA